MEEKNMIHFLKRLNYHKDVSIIWGWSNDGMEREHQFYFIYISFGIITQTLIIFTEQTPNDSWKKSTEFWLTILASLCQDMHGSAALTLSEMERQ